MDPWLNVVSKLFKQLIFSEKFTMAGIYQGVHTGIKLQRPQFTHYRVVISETLLRLPW